MIYISSTTTDIVYKNNNGKIIHGDNIDVMNSLEPNTVDSCISDFPYAIEFMGKNWDSAKCWNTGEGKHGTFKGTGYTGKKRPAFYQNTNEDKLIFYEWCKARAEGLHRILKPGGYACIFGHHKTNHRMKCAFEDSGFKIVEEIDWITLTGFPKSQDISKMFDKKAGKIDKRETIGKSNSKGIRSGQGNYVGDNYKCDGYSITLPATELARRYTGFRTAGLKPSHETITIFQKPLEGTYCGNIEKYGCGGMNIDACRVKVDNTSKGRFPPNIILDEQTASLLDEQTGKTKSTSNIRHNKKATYAEQEYRKYGKYGDIDSHGYDDADGGSRMFPIMKYCPKVAPEERKLPDGTRNPHVTLKPIELIKWLIKLVTPKEGLTIDITAGSCTHSVAVEQLNRDEGYNLKWINIELLNTEKEPYCNVGKMRLEDMEKGESEVMNIN